MNVSLSLACLGHIMAKATALRINLAPSIPSAPRPPPRNSHACPNAQLIYALNLSHNSISSLAHECAGRTLIKVVAFASRKFSTFSLSFSAFAQLSNRRLSLSPFFSVCRLIVSHSLSSSKAKDPRPRGGGGGGGNSWDSRG